MFSQGNQTVVTGLPAGFIDDLKWLLRNAYDKHGILVCVSLWSHDILAVRRLNSVANRARAVEMMSDDAATAAYINNALLPMLSALDEPMRPGGPTYLEAVISWDGEVQVCRVCRAVNASILYATINRRIEQALEFWECMTMLRLSLAVHFCCCTRSW
jgi:hypothetical protein